MKIMNVDDFINKASSIVDSKTIYKLGTFGNKVVNGKVQFDCSGLYKGILWGYPKSGKYQSNNVLDQNANTIINGCQSVSSDFSTIQKGEIVWIDGHMGIYIGNGKVIEATPKWDNGVQITTCANITNGTKARKWTKHGKSPHIDYGNEVLQPNKSVYDNWIVRLQQECNKQGYSNQTVDGIAGANTLAGCPQLGRKSKGNITRLLQERLSYLGYSCGKIDGINGVNTQKAIKQFQIDHNLVNDGIVGTKTWRVLIGL